MDPRSLNLTTRINNEQENLIKIDDRIITDRQNIKRLAAETSKQEQFIDKQEHLNKDINHNRSINNIVFILLGIVIFVVLVLASIAYFKAEKGEFPENSISAQELDNNDSFTFKNLNLTGGGNSTLTIENPEGITFGSSQITADEFRVIDGAIAGRVIASKTVVVDANRNIHGFGYITAGGASFSDGVCFKNLVTAEAGMSVLGGTSFSNLARFYDGLCVLGGTSFNNLTNFYGGINVGGTLYSYGGLSVSGVTNFSNLVTVESNTGLSVQSGISLSGAINLYSQLNSIEGICILGGLSVPGVAQLYGETRIAKNISLNTTEMSGICAGYSLSLNQSGYEFFVDYANNTHIKFILPSLSAGDTGHNYKFLWTEGLVNGGNYTFGLCASSNNINGTIVEYEKTTNNVYVINSSSADDYRLDLNSIVLDGSKLSVESYNGNWVVDGTVGISPSANALDTFGNNNYKDWIVGAAGTIFFSNDASNWYETYSLPDLITSSVDIWDVAYGDLSSGTSLYVAVCLYVNSATQNILYSNTGTDWQFATGIQFLNRVGLAQGRGVAFGQDNLGNDLWVAIGKGDGGVNNILFSNNGTCWMNSHSGGETFDIFGSAAAFGTNGSGSCLWVATGNNTNTTKTLLWSDDGMFWARCVFPGGTYFAGFGSNVAYGTDNLGNPLWVACGQDVTAYKRLLWSNDGMCWAQSSSSGADPSGGVMYDVAYGVSSDGTCLWVATGEDAVCSIFRSTDGMIWSRASNTTFDLAGEIFTRVVYGNNLWTALKGATTNNIIHSVDGLNWYLGNYGTNGYTPHSIAYNRPLYPNRNNLIDNIYT
jgi:hypothetical protein